MNNQVKRYRQISLIESFACSKRQKNYHTKMNENIETHITSSTTENNLSSTDLHETLNDVCQAAEDSVGVIDENCKVKAETSTIKAEIDKKGCDSGIQNSADLFPENPSLEDYSIPSSSYSDELFSDSVKNDSSESLKTSEDSGSDDMDISYLNKTPHCSIPLPKLEPLRNHSIMFSPHIRPGDAPRPYPSSYTDKWDADHVRMPCSPLNRYPVENSLGERHIESRWNLICRSLRRDIGSSKDLEEAIMKYNSQYIGKWNFLGLHAFINKHLKEEERDHFFEVVLPVMIQMTLDLPNICTRPMPLLKRGKDHCITISQKQIGCLLLNAFFCTFPRRTLPSRHSKQRWNCEYATYPDINFNRLFAGTKNGIVPRNAEKLKCLLNYFRRIISEEPSGTVTFHRQSLSDDSFPRWHASTRGIRNALIKASGLIETDGHGMLQVDFANKFVGGGVLGQGCVQEEIRFIICPELIVSRLFVERLDNKEVLIVTGVEQYNKYSGYSDDFKWEGDFRDQTERDSWGRRYTQLVAMDATHFHSPDEQFKLQYIKRELNKAYCAFYENALPTNLSAVATGNWGCGAYKGNSNLKFLIQLMAASETGRSLLYFTFGNKKLKAELQDMYNFVNDKNLAVGDVWRLLIRYAENVSLLDTTKFSLYDFIYNQFLTKEENCRKQEDGSSEEQFLDDSDRKAAEILIQDVACDDASTEIEDNS